MKRTQLLTIAMLVSAMSASAQRPTPIAPAPVLPEKAKPAATTTAAPAYQITTSKDWQNPEALRNKLGKQILAKLKGTDEKAVKSFLASQTNRLLLANWLLVNNDILSEKQYADYAANLEKRINDIKKNIENKEKELPELGGSAVESTRYAIDKLKAQLADLQAEARQPIRLADVVKRPRASRLINLISNDLGWIGEVVYSGECIMPGRMLNMLANMMERYTRMLPNERVPRDIATATALEYARFGWTVNNACERAEYFVRNWRQDRLHPMFDTMPFWQRRVVCGWKGDHSSGTPESFTWALNQVNLPDDRHTGSCWRCGYVLHNVYGDIIHGSSYFAPFEGMYLDNHHKFTQEVGGVCGGLSHFGASAACAHGIPGLTMGEPAHCAYVVWVDGKWTPAYSVSWDRGLHWRPWLDNWRYSSLHLQTEMQSPEQKEALRLSNAFRVLAHLHTTHKDTAKAVEAFLKAEAAMPINYHAFREHAILLAETKADTAAWLKLNESICKQLTPKYAECAASLLQSHVYDPLLKSGATAEQLRAAFALFWQCTQERGPERWKVQDILNKQISLLNSSHKGHDLDNKCELYRSMLMGSLSKPDYLTYSIDSGNQLMQNMDDAGKSRILAIMAEGISNGGDMEAEARNKVIADIILATENTRDAEAFQAISKLITPEAAHCNRPIGDFEAFPGKLVSEGGVLYASSTSSWDHPGTHANVLTKLGGQIHTSRNKDPWIAVKLPKHATISGVVIAAHSSSANWHRLNDLQIQVSETGKDDDWHNAGTPSGKCTQRLIRFDLTAENPKALHVRVIRPGATEVFHIDGIYVFGTPAA